MAKNPEVYPVTAKLEDDLQAYRDHPFYNAVINYIGEYEHGTAEPSDIHPTLTLEAMASLMLDFMLSSDEEE